MTGPRSIAVIGGGITGLAAAHRLGELAAARHAPIEVTLFEASGRVGGVFGTESLAGHTVETGADSFITNKPWALELCRRLGLEERIITTNPRYRRSLILYRGQPQPTPDGLELIVPRSLRSLFASPLLSQAGKFAVAAEPFVPAKSVAADESLADFVRRRMGPEMLERIVQPLVGGIYTSDPEHLSMQATLPRFVQMEREHGSLLRAVSQERDASGSDSFPVTSMGSDPPSISGARYGLFVSLRGGMSELLDALEACVRKSAYVELNTAVRAIEPLADGGYRLTPAAGDVRTFDGVIVALPAYRAAALVSDWDAQLAGHLDRIPYASSAIVVTGHRLADIAHPLDAFGLVVPHVEGRRILAVSFLSRKFEGRSPEGTVQLRTFVGGAMQPDVLQQDDAALVAMVREELRDLLGVTGEPLFQRIARYERGMPQYHVGHLDLVAAIEARERSHVGFALAGNAYRGVGIPDSIHSGETAVERIFNFLTSSQ
ncbi:MAG: protoporphyrinogen oxidase [Planctomycetaceae bacterium]